MSLGLITVLRKLWTNWSIVFVFSVINFVLPSSFGEIYTSVVNVQEAISVEQRLLTNLRIYIENEALRLDDIKRFYAKISALHRDVYSGPNAVTANPLVAFTLIKRLQSNWPNVAYSNEGEQNIQALRDGYKKEESTLPTFEDVQGAAKALMRLQDVYGLRVGALVDGHFQRVTDGNSVIIYKPAVSVRFSGDDCFLIGRVAYQQEDYYHSVQWLEEAVRLFHSEGSVWRPENDGSLEDTLDYLAFSHFKTGNVSHALTLSQELLRYEPLNGRVLQNVEKYEKLLVAAPAPDSQLLRRPRSTYLRNRDKYEWLCQSQGVQPRMHEDPALWCDYFTNGSPGFLLRPVGREVLSLRPYVVLYHDFVTSAEAHTIRDLARPVLKRSVVASGENQAAVEYRISKSAWLKETAHPIVRKLNLRIGALTGLNLEPPHAEHLQVVNYGIGGHYEPHFDHATSSSSPLYKLKTGNRVATFMIYLSSVEAGGSTAFIHANFSIPVVENAALFWWNLQRNGEGNGDTLHAGCPVLVGNKWVANKWVHERGQEFRHRCSLDPSE